jgi:predicted DNA-binding ArsR family transcriptional regulator
MLLKVNLNKTKIMIFSKGHKNFKRFNFFYSNLEIEIVEKYKYLGIIIYFNGNLKHAVEHLYNQSLKALFSLHSKIFGFNNIDHRLKLKKRAFKLWLYRCSTACFKLPLK